jgi:hypothetical protein
MTAELPQDTPDGAIELAANSVYKWARGAVAEGFIPSADQILRELKALVAAAHFASVLNRGIDLANQHQNAANSRISPKRDQENDAVWMGIVSVDQDVAVLFREIVADIWRVEDEAREQELAKQVAQAELLDAKMLELDRLITEDS